MDLKKYVLWTAVITPMQENGEVDYQSFAKVLTEQAAAGNGILILGSTGEALNLNEDERRKILKFTLEQNLSVPIMVGVGGVNLQETQEWVEHLETMPFSCYLMVTPLYAKPGPIGQYQWFKKLMDISTKPVVLYNVPSRTGVNLPFETVAKLRQHKNFFGIKEASGSLEDFKKFREIIPDKMLFSGDDALMPDFSALGADGLISVAANVWPKPTHEFVSQCLNGQLTDPALWQQAISSLFIAANPIPVKVLMTALGSLSAAILRPPLTHEDLSDKTPLFTAHNNINDWYQRNKGKQNV